MNVPQRHLQTFRQLQTFAVVAQFESFVDASKLLHVTPAALSISIKELEETLGFRLFDRTTRSVKLTDAGRQYLSCVERILAELRTSELCARDLRDRGSGIVRIATTQLITLTLLLPAFATIRAKRPEVRPILLTISGDEGATSVEIGQADIAIATQTPTNENVEAIPLFRSKVYFVCDSGHRFARRKQVRWGEIGSEPLVFVGQGARLRIFAQLPLHLIPTNTIDAGNVSAALAMVASGFGSAICSGYVKPITQMHKLRAIVISEPFIVRTVSMFSMHSSVNAPSVALHKRLLSEYFAISSNRYVENQTSTST